MLLIALCQDGQGLVCSWSCFGKETQFQLEHWGVETRKERSRAVFFRSKQFDGRKCGGLWIRPGCATRWRLFLLLYGVPNSQLSPITLANQPKVTYRFPVVVDIPKNDVAGPVMRFCFPETETADGSSKKQKKKKKKELKKAVKRYPQNSLRFYWPIATWQ